MKWFGPYQYKTSVPGNNPPLYVGWGEEGNAIKNQKGVYLLVVKTELGQNIDYVGTAHGVSGFQGRLETSPDSHLSCYLDGRYMLKDPERLIQGYFDPLNYGLLNLELSMRGPQGIQNEKLPQDLVGKVQKIHDLGMENRKTLLPLIEDNSFYETFLCSQPDCVAEWKRRLHCGMSVRNPPSAFKEYNDSWKQLNKLLKEYYLERFFYTIDGPKVGFQLLQTFEIYVCPIEEKNQSFELEGTIFQSVCHHPIQWVREFVAYALVQPLQNGSPKNLDTLRNNYGLNYQVDGDRIDLLFK